MNVQPIENIKTQFKAVEEYVGLAIAVSTIVIFIGKRVKGKSE